MDTAMESNLAAPIKAGATLRRPVQIIKKRSGPLEDALSELNEESPPVVPTATSEAVVKTKPCSSTAPRTSTVVLTTSPPSSRRRSILKEKEKKRERWLLTRKTWKYMTDAGRKLIPDSAQNRKEDVPKVEAHFQEVCANESRFILWRRKASYPGATRNSKRRLKQLLQHTGPRQAPTKDVIEQEEANNADQIIDLLQTYLKLDETCKTTTLLGSKTVRPDQTASPSSQRPGASSKHSTTVSATLLRSSGHQEKQLQQLNTIDQLLERLRMLSRSATLTSISIPPESITSAILEDKALLKQIYNSLKKQQLHRVLNRHSTPFRSRKNLTHSSSLSNLLSLGSSAFKHPQLHHHQDTRDANTHVGEAKYVLNTAGISNISPPTAGSGINTVGRTRKPPSSLDLTDIAAGSKSTALSARKKPNIEKQFNSCGTQTNFIQLQEIKRLAEEYKQQKREDNAAMASSLGTPGATDDEAEKLNPSSPTSVSQPHNRRKSSIDNEDVSQSVSDTIKRYLRMARKKSVHDDNANRFKRVNYDRNLRNIRAKGEINPPGMDEDNSKAVQTLDAWSLITLEFIRGNESNSSLEAAHAEWRKALDERIQKKLEYEQKLQLQEANNSRGAQPMMAGNVSHHPMHKQSPLSSCSSSSAPTSPTSDQFNQGTPLASPGSCSGGSGSGSGILSTSSQFLSNLWHGAAHSPLKHQHQYEASQNRSSTSLNSNRSLAGGITNNSKNGNLGPNMQKSKSSSNVGQFVSRKILKNRSKSQSRTGPQNLQAILHSKWAPSEKYTWTSENGTQIRLYDTHLHHLSEIEAQILQRVAVEKISELSIGVTLKAGNEGKSQKRRVLPKKKAMTTSFFDMGKKDEQASSPNVFGNSLESCVANDKKRECGTLMPAAYDRGSRNSIASLFRSSNSGGDSSVLNENIRSCESLPSETNARSGSNGNSNSSSTYFSGLTKSSSMHISRSQSDVRRKSQDYDSVFDVSCSASYDSNHNELQVPNFINSCIKHLEKNGLHKVGLFRVSTSKKRVKQMRDEFDKNVTANIEDDICPHDVATLLKEFLRDLPEPLLCSHLHKAFLETQKIRNRRLQLEAMSHLVKLLPPAHRDTLYVLLRFLAKVAAFSDDVTDESGLVQINGNKMDSNNLATVFAPNILRSTLNYTSRDPTAANRINVSEQDTMNDAINVIRIMIDHYEELFKVPAELIDIVYSHMLDICPDKLYSLCEQRSTLAKEEIAKSCSSLPIGSPEQSTPADKGLAWAGTPSRLYTREDVMHDNDASKAFDAVMNGSTDSRSRSSHSMLHHDERRKSEAGLSSAASIERRQSTQVSPENKIGVVSGSLQIPMPMQTHFKPMATPSHDQYSIDDVFYKPNQLINQTAGINSFEYTDIPYIEDASNGQEMGNLSECFPISGSLSFSTKPDPSKRDACSPPQRSQPQSEKDNGTFRLRRESSGRTVEKTREDSSKASRISAGTTNKKTDFKKKPLNVEPKLPASISNIGGAILRSKTADFERMTARKQQQQLKTSPNPKGAVAGTSERTHLYKRQELIPSAKRFIPK